ncbi:MAG: RND transporter [Alcanivorax borkumensis]|jgi:predicted RND superfamily exporter protein|nr:MULTISPECIES: efflux RND transporter permease subunit [Alcanivorax]EUC69882.1 RND transporter [Alcanivorax sp. 97CO-5]OJH07587.1 MAG: RND transporter [Alcanivorax borkumensis]PKG01735.1 RND transporter [Alcanivorax sp. 97CO-6]BAP13535.1 hypothetical protein AS19_06840 [Alcanivorax sp. NBRC 101098]
MINAFAQWSIRHRRILMALTVLMTIGFLWSATRLEIGTEFSDLQPSGHSYIDTNNRFKAGFGSENLVSIMLEVNEGDLFEPDVLAAIKGITDGLRKIPGVNPLQITSLASKKLKSIRASTYGIESQPLMWPDLPSTPREIAELRSQVIGNPLVHGRYVSRDLTAALITVDFFDHLIDTESLANDVQQLTEPYRSPTLQVRVVGEPVINSLVLQKLPETMRISLAIVGAVAVLLLLAMRTYRGMLLPLTAALVSGIWALGIVSLLGFSLNPLAIVISFVVSARALSHAVQFTSAFEQERLAGNLEPESAAVAVLSKLFRPGMLGLATDAGAILVVAATPIPFLQKVALIGTIWIGVMLFCVLTLVPLLLSWVNAPVERARVRVYNRDTNALMERGLSRIADMVNHRRGPAVVLGACVLLMLATAYYAQGIQIGDASPGSTVFWQDSEYNQDAAAITQRFLGADHLFVAVAGDEPDTLKQPAVLQHMSDFQREIGLFPEVAANVSIADIVRQVNVSLHEGNPRFADIGKVPEINSELIYTYLASSDPGDIERYADTDYSNGAIHLLLTDKRGDTIRNTIARLEDYITDHPLEGAQYQLAGGVVGVIAAVNQVILSTQVQSIALALLVLFLFCALAYRSPQAGLFFLPLVLISNLSTFAFMAHYGIGLNINTLPVAALGIGLGVDYGFYIVDRVRERYLVSGDLRDSVRFALATAGRGVLITAATMITSMLFWFAFSSLRFQAEMGLLIALWMAVSALTALVLIPALILMFKPRFIVMQPPIEAKSTSPTDTAGSATFGSNKTVMCNPKTS